MKERITYILAEGEAGVDPATVEVKADSIKLPGLRAAKEWRITLTTRDLPRSLQKVLDHVHELHVRWESLLQVDHTPPFSSRTPPGLHVFYTPISENRTSTGLCDEIRSAFGQELRCGKTENAFTQPQVLSERFASSSAFQYYQQLPLVKGLQDYIRSSYCTKESSASSCLRDVESLQQASSLDFDFDVISQSVIVTARWPPTRHAGIDRKRSAKDRVEVGILNREKATEDEQISLGGFLTVVGDDDEPKPTLFSFPSRHHQLPSSGPESLSFAASFKQPTGLHPTLQLAFNKHNIEPPTPFCSLHAYLTLPSALFIDRYQLSDKLFLQSQNLLSLRAISGETDLEIPDWVVQKWGSAALLELAVPDDDSSLAMPDKQWTVSIPTHLRYLSPTSSLNTSATHPDHVSDEAGKRTTTIPYPAVFWACPAESGLKMATNPFDRVNLGYDGLFGPKTLFWHALPSAARLDLALEVPVLDMSKTRFVELGTGVAVMAGFVWVCWKLLAGAFGEKTRTTNGGKAAVAGVPGIDTKKDVDTGRKAKNI